MEIAQAYRIDGLPYHQKHPSSKMKQTKNAEGTVWLGTELDAVRYPPPRSTLVLVAYWLFGNKILFLN